MSNNDIQILDKQTIEKMIYVIRGQKVMLGFDLARIYGYSTRALNQQVQRNLDKFPEEFMFQLTYEELHLLKSHIILLNEKENLMSQIVTSRWK